MTPRLPTYTKKKAATVLVAEPLNVTYRSFEAQKTTPAVTVAQKNIFFLGGGIFFNTSKYKVVKLVKSRQQPA